VASHWPPYGRSLAATGGEHISVGITSCSRAMNAIAQRASCILGTQMTASGFSVAANALGSPISPQWATVGTARRVVWRNCALGSNGERAALCPSSHEACTRERTKGFWGCLPTTRRCESRGRVTLENTGQTSIVPICGGNAETDLLSLVAGQFVDEISMGSRTSDALPPINIVIGSKSLNPRIFARVRKLREIEYQIVAFDRIKDVMVCKIEL
jgi:hypothetical protein